jgi:hypothetical protein
MDTCEKCGAKVCPHCGKAIEEAKPEEPQPVFVPYPYPYYPPVLQPYQPPIYWWQNPVISGGSATFPMKDTILIY